MNGILEPGHINNPVLPFRVDTNFTNPLADISHCFPVNRLKSLLKAHELVPRLPLRLFRKFLDFFSGSSVKRNLFHSSTQYIKFYIFTQERKTECWSGGVMECWERERKDAGTGRKDSETAGHWGQTGY